MCEPIPWEAFVIPGIYLGVAITVFLVARWQGSNECDAGCFAMHWPTLLVLGLFVLLLLPLRWLGRRVAAEGGSDG